MGRIFEENNTNEDIVNLLDRLVDKGTESGQYAQTMYELGEKFGDLILKKFSNPSDVIALDRKSVV